VEQEGAAPEDAAFKSLASGQAKKPDKYWLRVKKCIPGTDYALYMNYPNLPDIEIE